MRVTASQPRLTRQAVAAIAELYFRDGDVVCDATFGRGGWWSEGLQPSVRVDLGGDVDVVASMTELPFRDGSCDVVCFDPPFVPMGGVKSSTIPDFNERYGRHLVNYRVANPGVLRCLIRDGLGEALRVSRRLVVAKCQNYVMSGRFCPQVLWLGEDACGLGACVVDWFIQVRAPGPQPLVNKNGLPRRQVHARQNVSHLLVLGK